MSVQIGVEAPDFELKDQHGVVTKLSSMRGTKNVLLVFYPFAFTGVCSGELGALKMDLESFQNDETALFVVSCDTQFSQRVFAEQQGLEFPMLSDFWPHGAVAEAYGVFEPGRGCALRGSFVIDKSGIIRWQVINPVPEARDAADYVVALADLA